MAWGLEARVPFLDANFLEISMTKVPPSAKLTGHSPYYFKMEKYVLRKAFDIASGGKKYLPDEILWRQKEQFSDGVGYNWIDSLKAKAEDMVTSQEWESRSKRFPVDTPTSKEGYWFRKIFENHFGMKGVGSVVRWIPRKDWGCPEDPSGRAQKGHNAAY